VQDLVIGMAVNVLIQLVRDPNSRSKWRKALLKVFREIAIAFKDDAELTSVIDAQAKQV
jgi:hypothetical protein